MTTHLIILVILLLLSAFFSAAEVAFISLTNAKVEAMAKRKLPRVKLIKYLKKNPRRLLVTILIGNNIVNIGASSLATVVMANIFDSAVIGITTGVMTLLVLIFGEIIPKSYANNHPKKFAIFSAPTLRAVQWVMLPFVVAFEWITKLVAGEQVAQRVSEEELRALARTSRKQGAIEDEEGEMIERLFAFNDITAEHIMTPRVQMISMQVDQKISDASDIIEDHPFTRYPVIKGDPDHVVGFVHSRDVLLAHHKNKEKQLIKKIMHPMLVVPKQMPIDDVMREFQKRNTHIAVVVDEFGGTEGLVTFEDVIEELVGEITDEHDVDEDMIHRVDENTIIVAGDESLRDINDFFNCNIPGHKLDTIAEVMLDQLKKLPRKGQKVEFDTVTATVIEVKKKRIQRVEIKRTIT